MTKHNIIVTITTINVNDNNNVGLSPIYIIIQMYKIKKKIVDVHIV
jgi:hypothetical protein